MTKLCQGVIVTVLVVETIWLAHGDRGLIAATRDWPVVTTIADIQSGFPYRVESDHSGAYKNTQQIQSVVQAIGDWTLTTYSAGSRPSNRTVFFDLREPASAGITPPFPTAYVQSHLIAKCHLVNINMMSMRAGTFAQCPGSFRFLAPNGLWYRFSFQPDNFPEVNYMTITCNAEDTAGCKLWNVYPSGTYVTGTDPNHKNVNRLVQIDPGSDQVIGDVGDFYLSFNIVVSR